MNRTRITSFLLGLVVFLQTANAQASVVSQSADDHDGVSNELTDTERLCTTVEPLLSTKRPYPIPDTLPQHGAVHAPAPLIILDDTVLVIPRITRL